MNCSNSADRQSPSIAPPTRSFLVLLSDGTRLRVNCRDLAVQLRQERNATLKRLRQSRADALAEVADRIGEGHIRRQFEANERATDAAIRRLSKQIRIKPERRSSSSSKPSQKAKQLSHSHPGANFTKRTTSALARRDSLGREGMMLRIRYVRAGGKHAGLGCLRRHWRYIAREAAVTLDGEGQKILLGNLGNTIDEVADALGLQEQLLRETRKNAKLGFRMIGAFPYGLPVDARRDCLQRIGEELFTKRGLPWTAAAHDADHGAEADNPHFHLDYGLLSMIRQEDGSFIVSNDLRTDLDGQEGLRFIRHTVARVMTEVAQEYGLDRRFTALSYRERGMDREGNEHVGQEGTAAHRRGEYVATIARNELRQRQAQAREKAQKARERLEALERLKRAIVAMPESLRVTSEGPQLRRDVQATLAVSPNLARVPALVDVSPALSARITVPAPAIGALGSQIPDVSSMSAARTQPTSIHVKAMPPRGELTTGVAAMVSPTTSAAIPPTVRDTDIPPPLITPSPDLPIMTEPPPIVAIPSEARSSATMPPSIALDVLPDAPLSGKPAVPIVGNHANLPKRDVPLLIIEKLPKAPDIASPPVIVLLGPTAPKTLALPTTIATAPPVPLEGPVIQSDVPALWDVAPHTGEKNANIAPSAIHHIGPPVRSAQVVLPIMWRIGEPVSIDPADVLLEKEIIDATKRGYARSGDVADTQDIQRGQRDEGANAFELLRQHDEWLGQDSQGHYTVSDDALCACGMSRADLNNPAAQKALEEIGMAQVDRLDPVLFDRTGRPAFHVDSASIRLDDRFGADLRSDVARWSSNPYFRAFMGKVWPELRDAVAMVRTSRPSAETQRQKALEDMLAAIADERHYLKQEKGEPAVDPAMIARFGLLPKDVAGAATRSRLATLAERQAVELSKIATFVQKSPHVIVPDDDGWQLDGTAPADIRGLVAAWRNEAMMQQALGRIVAAQPDRVLSWRAVAQDISNALDSSSLEAQAIASALRRRHTDKWKSHRTENGGTPEMRKRTATAQVELVRASNRQWP
jgi:hypothetical protein